MFGFSFKDKVIKIISSELGYSIPLHSKVMLPGICNQAREFNLNLYDAAIFFISVTMNSLSDPAGDAQSRSFIDEKSRRAFRLIPQAASPRSEIVSLLDTVRTKANLPGLESPDQERKHMSEAISSALRPKTNEIFDKFFYDIHYDPEEPDQVLEKITRYIVSLDSTRPGLVNKVVSGLYGAVEGVGGLDALQHLDIEEIEKLANQVWAEHKTPRIAHEKAALLLFFVLLTSRVKTRADET